MNRVLDDADSIRRMSAAQFGVFSRGDLKTIFNDPHLSSVGRRIDRLVEHNVLRRFCRAWYFTEGFDLRVLSQRLAPDAYFSLGTALAHHLLIGTANERRVFAVRHGRGRKYAAHGYVIEHVAASPALAFGHEPDGPIKWATPEKAVIDTLYYYQKGRRFAFDIHSDIRVSDLDRARITAYLKVYKNPKFRAFVERFLDDHGHL